MGYLPCLEGYHTHSAHAEPTPRAKVYGLKVTPKVHVSRSLGIAPRDGSLLESPNESVHVGALVAGADRVPRRNGRDLDHNGMRGWRRDAWTLNRLADVTFLWHLATAAQVSFTTVAALASGNSENCRVARDFWLLTNSELVDAYLTPRCTTRTSVHVEIASFSITTAASDCAHGVLLGRLHRRVTVAWAWKSLKELEAFSAFPLFRFSAFSLFHFFDTFFARLVSVCPACVRVRRARSTKRSVGARKRRSRWTHRRTSA